MPLSNLLASTTKLEINDHRIAGQVVSRNRKILTSEIVSVQPYQFTLTVHAYNTYQALRQLLSELRVADRIFEQVLNFTGSNWQALIQYNGDLNATQVSALRLSPSSVNRTIVLTGVPTNIPTAMVVRTGDWIQIDRYAYQATANVPCGATGTVTIPVHRTILTTVTGTSTAPVIGQYNTAIVSGNSYTGISVPVFVQEYPSYALNPAYSNDYFVEFTGSFKMLEAVL